MGVTGLWRLIEPAGKPVPVETLENKVLAVDISIWLHQMVKGYQDAKGAPLPNAHLMGLFQRLCKLLYFRIKPIFVFDGGFPELKRETIAKRQDNKSKYNSESERLKRELALLLGKKTVVSSLLGKQISPKKGNTSTTNDDDIFKLPALPEKVEEEYESDSDEDTSSGSLIDLHSVDMESDNFKNMPVKDKYDLLIELKETRKMNSWGKLHELPKKSDNFSDFQLQRLLKRRKVQECLEETEKEMGDAGMSLNDLESLLNEEGIDTKIDSLPTRRVASDSTTRILMISNVKQALADAKKRQEDAEKKKNAAENTTADAPKESKLNELEEDIQKAIKMSLGESEADISNHTSKTDESWTSTMTDSDYSDSEDEDGFEQPDMNCAKSYIMQYSDFTHKAINNIVGSKSTKKGKSKGKSVNKIIEELNKEKSIIVDNVDLSSSDDECVQSTSIINDAPKTENLSNSDNNFERLENINETQASVVCIENPKSDIIELDSSIESEENIQQNPDFKTANQDSDDSDSNDEDFEEVPEVENQFIKPVVQLNLDMGAAPGEDDIFADIFTNENVTKTESDCIKRGVENSAELITSKINKIKEIHNESRKEISVTKTSETLSMDGNIREKTDEDIFIRPSTSGVKVVQEKPKNAETSKLVTPASETAEDEVDEDLERAIQMSLECVEDNTASKETNEPTKNIEEPKVNKDIPHKEPITTEQLNTMAEEIQNEEQGILQEKGRLDRIGRNITEQMTKEAQELLQIFGIPYIVAPTEAEAQCAFLESVNLTDGTITDDSDIWLFGGRTVYKNFFNHKKHVMQFQAERIERSFNLTREQLVLLALLVGSDYTTGVTGVGPVTALEILASFPFNKKHFLNETSKQARYSQIVAGLHEFKKWVRAGKRTDNITLKKKLKNVDLTEDFPSVRVVQAYLEPNVEKSEAKFTWGELDITILRDYAKAKFGWSQHKLDEIIKPVLKRLFDRKNQRSVQDYFKRKVEFQCLEDQMSKRVKAAVQKMGPDGLVMEEPDPSVEKVKPTRKRKLKNSATDTANTEKSTSGPSKKKKITVGSSVAIEQVTDESDVLKNHGVTVASQILDGKPGVDITIPKTDRFQEIIPQREKEKHSLLQNKMKAIEIFRKTKMDRKKKPIKRKVNLPKEKADLSESSDSA